MTIDLVIFDLAGTTVEDRDTVGRSFREALSAAGIKADPAAVTAVMGLPKIEAVRLLVTRAGRNDLLDRVEAIHDDFVDRMLRHYRESTNVAEVPGTTEVFQKLRQAGIKAAVNSGFSRDIIQILLDRFGWVRNGLIAASVASDEVTNGRPNTEMITKIMNQLEITDPIRVAKIGDTPADLEEGTNAGCGLVVGVTEGTHTREQLQVYPHTHLIGTVAELPRLLGLS